MKIKKLIAGCLAGILTLSLSVPAKAAESYEVHAPHMYAHAYAVMDANSGEILFGEKVDKKIYPASTAKLMSAIVAVESGIDLDTVVKTQSKIVRHTTVGTYDLDMYGGEYYTLRSLLNMSLIASAADATDMMAVAVAGSKSAFAEKMMEKVEELGLTRTSFDNPVGSDIGASFNETYSTATEMCKIARYAMANKTIRNIVAKHSYTITGDNHLNGRQISNTNWFYNRYPYNKDYFTIIGTKTGQTTAAGDVFIATAVDTEGHELICAYFGQGGKEETFRWINYLLTYAMKQYKKGNLTMAKGAYNIRYDQNATAYVRSMTKNVLKQSEGRVLDLDYQITEKQAMDMIETSLAPELSGTRITSHFDALTDTGKDTCSKDYFVQALKTALPGMEKRRDVAAAIQNAADTLTCEDAGCILGAAIRSFPLYQASFPTYEMRTWTPEDPVPFASVVAFTDLTL